MRAHETAFALAARTCRAGLKVKARLKTWEWLEQHASIPMISGGSANSGPYSLDVTPQYRWVYDQFDNPRIHFLTFCAAARIGKTLIPTMCIQRKVVDAPGPILWVDPTRKTGARFSRTDLEPFLRECKPVADLIVDNREDWTTLEKRFTTCTLGIVGAGSPAELAGRQAEMIVMNELDKWPTSFDSEAPPDMLAEVRSMQFELTRKIFRNSTPTTEDERIWQAFLAGSQHYYYVPCPHCGTMQRLTFWTETVNVPFDEAGEPLPRGEFRKETTGRIQFDHIPKVLESGEEVQSTERRGNWNLSRIETEVRYECANPSCTTGISYNQLGDMLRRGEWRAHNPEWHLRQMDHVSIQHSGLYSPFFSWGQLTLKFLQAIRQTNGIQDFRNSYIGLPFKREAGRVSKKQLRALVDKSPVYHRGEIPYPPVILTLTADIHKDTLWWSVRAWGILAKDDELRSWSALVDWGQCATFDDIEWVAALRESRANEHAPGSKAGRINRYPVRGTMDFHTVKTGLIDSGYDAQQGHNVYDFCARWSAFSASKGESGRNRVGKTFWESPSSKELPYSLVLYDDDHARQGLYYGIIKEHRKLWFLPQDIDDDYEEQLTDEFTEEVNGRLVWKRRGNNHLGDTEKMHELLRDTLECGVLDDERMRLEDERSKAKPE